MSTIEEKGWFLHGPTYWENRQVENELDYLLQEGKISSLTDEGIKYLNSDYFYIKKGNPDQIFVNDKGLLSKENSR